MKAVRTIAAVKKTNQEFNERLARDFAAIAAQRDEHTLTESELDSVLGELIDTINIFQIECAFDFRTNLNETEGHFGDHSFMGGFMKKLVPYAEYLEERIRTALVDEYPDKRPGEPDSDLTEMKWLTAECTYVIGVFMGAKLAGASNETLNLLRKHLVF